MNLCMFCYEPLTKVSSHPGSDNFIIVLCRACQSPDYYTLHREMYDKKSGVKIYDQVQVDEYIVTRYHAHNPTTNRSNYSKLYKESFGVLDTVPDATPITKYPAVCEFDHIIELPTYDLEVLKKKLRLWTTFS